jgi:predicted dehydrogenase
MSGGLTVAVLGAGSVGRRHITNLKALGVRVVAWRERAELAAVLARELEVEVLPKLDDAIAAADAVVVATATDRHLAPALAAARMDRHLFIEKPVAHATTGLADLRAATGHLVVEVGCQLRFHPALRHLRDRIASGEDGRILTFRAAVGQRLSDWRPGTDWKQGYSAAASRGGGALFDLIHEIDLVNWLVGPSHSVSAVLTPSDNPDLHYDTVANLITTTTDGISGQVQMDMVAPCYRRDLEIVTEHSVYRFDYGEGTLQRTSPHGSRSIYRVPKQFQRNQMFLDHMRCFLDRIGGHTDIAGCSLDDGILAVATAHAARISARDNIRVFVRSIT